MMALAGDGWTRPDAESDAAARRTFARSRDCLPCTTSVLTPRTPVSCNVSLCVERACVESRHLLANLAVTDAVVRYAGGT